MDAAIQLVQLYEANYPELLRRVFVINGTCLKKSSLGAPNYIINN